MRLCGRHIHNLTSICSYISIVFGNNKNYIEGIPLKHSCDITEIESLFNMLNAKGAFSIDERSNTVEIISQKSIDLTDAIECIILSKNLSRHSAINKFIKDNNINYKTYTVRNLTDPASYNSVVFELTMQYLEERGLI